MWSCWRLYSSRALGSRLFGQRRPSSRREAFEDQPRGVARPPRVPGYVTEELLGLGGTGEVWAAREEPSGRPVALKRLRVATDIAAREGLRREGELLAAFTHPNVIGFHGLRHDGEGLVLVLERAATSLSAVVSSGGPLSPAEAVGVAAPIADALAEAHAVGLVHGDVSPANVLLRADGHPLLADLGTAAILVACGSVGSFAPAEPSATADLLGSVGPFGTAGFADHAARLNGGATPASDVYSLAAVLTYALSGRPLGARPGARQRWADAALSARVPAALITVVCEALAAEPGHRLGAAGFAKRLRAAAPPSPLRFGPHRRDPAETRTAREARGVVSAPDIPVTSRSAGEAATRPVEPSSSQRVSGLRRWCGTRRVRRMVLAALTVLVLGGGVGVAGPWAWAVFGASSGTEQVAEAGGRQGAGAGREWAAIMGGLDVARGRAFATANVDELRNVYEPGSPMHDNDRRQLVALRNVGLVVVGVHHRFGEARLLNQDGATATLQLTERLEPYSVVRIGGGVRNPEPEVVRAVSAGEKRTVTVRLGKTDGRWRIVTLTPS